MAQGHQDAARDNAGGAPDHPVGDKAANQGRGVGDGPVEAGDRRGQRLAGQGSVDMLEQGFEGAKPDDVLNVAGLQQVAGHVENQQRLHAVVGESDPPFGSGQERQALGMAEEGPVALVGGGLGGAQERSLDSGQFTDHAAGPTASGRASAERGIAAAV